MTYGTGSSSNPGYIPELGLWRNDKGNGNNEANVATLACDQDFIFEAGTDCLGFVQRSIGWSGSKTTYAWQTLLPGMMDYGNGAGTSVPGNVYKSAAALQRHFPRDSADSAVIMAYDQGSADSSMLESLRHVVPGDIWFKYRTVNATSQTGATPSHIAIVSKIPEYSSNMTVMDFMNGMVLLEGEYNNKIQSVIKALSVGDYDHNNFTSVRVIYQGVTYLPDDPNIDLHCASWAIRRLN